MSKKKVDNAAGKILYVAVLLVIVVLNSPGHVSGADDDETEGQTTNPAAVHLFTQALFTQFSNLSRFFADDVRKHLSFCITDVDADWNSAFNFSSDLTFLNNCIKKTKGDLTQRLCTAAEIKFYLNSFFQEGSKKTNYLRPNRNCNLNSWVSGCEPGWACSVGKGKKVDLKNSKVMPDRTLDCQPCCEGFFCPNGITCMIREYVQAKS